MLPLGRLFAIVAASFAPLSSAVCDSGHCLGDETSLMQKSTQLSPHQPVHQRDSLLQKVHEHAPPLPAEWSDREITALSKVHEHAPPVPADWSEGQLTALSSKMQPEQMSGKQLKAARREAKQWEFAAQEGASVDAMAQWEAARMMRKADEAKAKGSPFSQFAQDAALQAQKDANATRADADFSQHQAQKSALVVDKADQHVYEEFGAKYDIKYK